jgi:hypothetical protein
MFIYCALIELYLEYVVRLALSYQAEYGTFSQDKVDATVH